ncbi:siderophore ABC transporter substrate-binding protein [Agrobacterium vitis]|uniref:siderophore ABC transporter substrate-binding protein n=2 Tax=Rhizobium/Agrobacterium group TaxID=227290 RepID=UPI002034470E|nr:siderophore ABC transporter substrate-binding protein [Agrobacterium vitis]MCF1501668.1 siderophore ABC transporter substrate-binding protein [Allorhizobium sp. Av2]MCM2438546.1 siderophore ABC transporter substrate-binding protein [Agrobacterium vitis]MCM2473117.1 siderophore ABC transporter substrate-binding protein [Rhizobium sp. CG5]
MTAAVLTLAATLYGVTAGEQDSPATAIAEPVIVQHELGTATLASRPKRVVSFDMSVVDSLDQMGISVIGMPKDYVPRFLSQYADNPDIADLGSTIQPNLERVHRAKPDLILISPLTARSYQELSQIAPTIYFDFDFMNKSGNYIEVVKKQLGTLGRVFGVEARAEQLSAEIDRKVEEARQVTNGRPEKALVIMHSNGSFTTFGVKSRYGFIFDTLGVKPASLHVDPGPYGQPISNEFIHDADPDIIYVVDRMAAIEHRSADPAVLENPLLRETKAWKNGRVLFVDPDSWFLTSAGAQSLQNLIGDVIKSYEK